MKLVTANDAQANARILKCFGQRLYRETGHLKLPAPFKSFQGRFHDEAVLYELNGKPMVRKYVVPTDPKTPKQLQRRSVFGQPQRQRHRLSIEQRKAWEQFALEHHPPVQTKSGNPEGPCGLNRFTQAQCNRLSMGLSMRFEAPTAPPPRGVIGVVTEPVPEDAAAETAFAFRITHTISKPQGLRVLIENEGTGTS